jgi:Fe(3+) dicitrate transport protein
MLSLEIETDSHLWLNPFTTMTKLFHSVLLAAALVAALVHPSAAETRAATLTGRVVDQTGAAIARASVSVRRDATGFARQLVSDGEGAFELTDLLPGEYAVTVTSTGFTVAAQRVTLQAGQRRGIELTLQVGSLNEDVVVLASEVSGNVERLRRLPGSVDVVDREMLDRANVMTTNEALRKIPGVNVRDEEGLGLRPNIGIRGLNPTRSNKVLLLEDGIPLTYAPYGDNASYYHPPIERFERIEVFKGGAQIGYGPQTISGLVNYITPAPPSRSAGAVHLAGGNRAYFNGHANYGNTIGNTGFLFDYMRKQGDGSRENLHSDLNDVNLKLTHSRGTKQVWTLRSNYYSEDSNITYSGLRQSEWEANPRANPFKNDFFYVDRYGTSVTHGYTLNGNVALTTNAYFTSFRRHWWRQSSNSGQRPNRAAEASCGGMANLNTTCGIEGRLRQYYTVGVEPRLRVHHRAFGMMGEADFGVRVHFEQQNRRQENGTTPTARSGQLVEHNLRSNQAYSTFALNRFLFGDWTVTPGVRVEHVRFERTNQLPSANGATGNTDLTQVIPGIGVSHTIGSRVTTFAGVHRGFAPPRTEDVIGVNGGVIDLDSELSWNYEVGARTELARGVRVDGTFFRMDYENQIVQASLAGGVGATLTNGGSTLHQGMEVVGRIDSAPMLDTMHNVSLRLAYTHVPVAKYTGVRFSNIPGFATTSISGNRLTYAPEQILTFGVGYAQPSGLDLLLEVVHMSDQFGDDLNTVAGTADGQRGVIPAYTILNSAVNYDLGRATVFFTIKNLLNDTFIVDRARGILPGMPRLLQVGVRTRF